MRINKYLYLSFIIFCASPYAYADDAYFLPDSITCTGYTINTCSLPNPYFKIGINVNIVPGTYSFQGARSDFFGLTRYTYQVNNNSLEVDSQYFSINGDMQYRGTAWRQDYGNGGFVCDSKTAQACPFNNVPF